MRPGVARRINKFGRAASPAGRRTLLALTFGTLLAICGVFAYVMKDSYDDVDRGVAASAGSLVAAVAQNVDRNIEILDVSLHTVASAWNKPAIQALSPEIRAMVLFDEAKAPGFGAMLVLGPDGAIRGRSDDAQVAGQSFADRDYFQVHLFNRDVGLFVSKPFVSRISGDRTVGLSRRIDNPDGSFGGVVVGTLKLSYLAQLYAGIDVGPDGVVILFRTDGTIITREPYVEADVHKFLGASDAFNKMRSSRTGSFDGASPLDGQRRIVSFHRVGNLPLIQDVEVSGGAAYAGWWRKAIVVAALLACLCIGSLVLSLLLHSELRRRAVAEARLERLAGTDGLTGLANRRRFATALRTAWNRACGDGSSLAMLMIDADRFKSYNDIRGHLAGDEVLKAIAGCIASCVNGSGSVACRFGGEEFAVLLPGTDVSAASRVAELIRGRVVALGVPHPGDATAVATVSIGVACIGPTPGLPTDSLIAAADEALYRAKGAGRNCCRTARAADLIAA